MSCSFDGTHIDFYGYMYVKLTFKMSTYNKSIIKMSNADVKRLISKLPENAALVFNLYVYEEYNHNEISALLKIPSGTSRYYLSEARRLLKEVVTNNIHSLNKM